MTSPITDPSLWSDGATPPASWNGAFFELFGVPFGGTVGFYYIGPPITAPFDIVLTGQAPDEYGYFSIIADDSPIDGTDSNIYGNPLNYGEPRTFTIPACSTLVFSAQGGYGPPDYDYGFDMTIEAVGTPAVGKIWTDFVGTVEP